ncbi:DHA2 family efflux MFS transporter permease subunit [Propionivibrio sp.]|jgi:DHA2 family multidrug resistance protein|uniref:DHA2 family efflux MFS transporter permease subunit n=1 Tax=Betaproteobacteria TaxID=28216 RepID=UPI001B43E6B7|nr:DHA2 family efflux MFS transporter permease subunit [Propionivibrio sp.]MBK8359240.1 DHA2 family efflux MFS transporter permease subunit [Comamonadaceae bacterium]MBP8275799.1 DHA2 family efflux MFS transporter permease subunit [Propionivibrio sp.]
MSTQSPFAAELNPASEINRPMITLSIMLATVIQALDGTIANVALPHMQGNLSASQDQITWVLTSFIVAAAIAMPLTGWLCDRFGQKNVFLSSVAGFTLASVLCGLSGSLAQIVAARLLQGAFGAALVPLSQAVLLDINPREKQGQAMAIWGMGVMIGPILGPTLGGWLTDSYNWRWVFFINVPIGALAFYGIWKYIRQVPGERRMKFDMFGFATLSLAIGALQMLLDRGEQNDWFSSAETWVEAVLLTTSFIYFVIHTRLTAAEESFFDYRLLKNRNYVTGLLFVFVVGIVLFSVRALAPTMLQNLMHYPAAMAGLVTAPSGVGTLIAMVVVGRLIGKVDFRMLLLFGFSITAISLWQMSGYTLVLSQSDIVWPGVVQGIGLGLVFVPLSTATFATVSASMRAQGTAIYSLIRNIGSSIGIALVQALLVRNTQIMHVSLAEKINYANPAFQDAAIASAYGPGNSAGLAALNVEVSSQAAMIGYTNDFRLMMILVLMVIPLLLLVQSPKSRAPAPIEHIAAE